MNYIFKYFDPNDDLLEMDYRFSKVCSYDHMALVRYLKSWGLNSVVSTITVNNVVVPMISISIVLTYGDIDNLNKILSEVRSMYGWDVSSWELVKKPQDPEALPQLGQALIMLFSKFRQIPVAFKFKPIELDPDKISRPEDPLELNYLYHITLPKNVNSILKNGLIPSGDIDIRSDKDYYHFKCVHLLRYLGGPLAQYEFRSVRSKLYEHKSVSLLKVGPISELKNYVFFIDPDAPLEGVVTPNKINPKYISLVTGDQIKLEFVGANINTYRPQVRDKVFSTYWFFPHTDLNEIIDPWIFDRLNGSDNLPRRTLDLPCEFIV